LKQNFLSRLFQARALENDDTVNAFTSAEPPGTHHVRLNGQLFGGSPSAPAEDPGICSASELNLRRYQFCGSTLAGEDREQDE
jgi:hypothetical protein